MQLKFFDFDFRLAWSVHPHQPAEGDTPPPGVVRDANHGSKAPLMRFRSDNFPPGRVVKRVSKSSLSSLNEQRWRLLKRTEHARDIKRSAAHRALDVK